jgi:hypothetical protein
MTMTSQSSACNKVVSSFPVFGYRLMMNYQAWRQKTAKAAL